MIRILLSSVRYYLVGFRQRDDRWTDVVDKGVRMQFYAIEIAR